MTKIAAIVRRLSLPAAPQASAATHAVATRGGGAVSRNVRERGQGKGSRRVRGSRVRGSPGINSGNGKKRLCDCVTV